MVHCFEIDSYGVQAVGIAMMDITSRQPQTNLISSPHALNSGNSSEFTVLLPCASFFSIFSDA
jgi:hypothetical protein